MQILSGPIIARFRAMPLPCGTGTRRVARKRGARRKPGRLGNKLMVIGRNTDMNWRIGKGMLAVAIAAVLMLSAGWSAAAPSQGEHEIAGTWVVTVQLNNCSGTPIGGKFQSLLTFNNGGTMIEDTMNPGFATGQRGTGHGVWEYQGEHKFAVKSVAFINFTTTPPPPPGFKAGTQTITQTIVFPDGPDEWTADAQVQFADTTPTVYRNACATATAVRFE